MAGPLELLGDHAFLLAVVLPPAIRVAGHWLPEEPLMVALGVVAATRGGPEGLAVLLVAWASHLATDQTVFTVGLRLRPRVLRVPRAARRVVPVARRLARSPWALWWLVPARVLPLGRGAWLLAAGMAAVPRARFAVVDAVAVTVHVAVWCGLGWLARRDVEVLLALARPVTLWVAAAAAGAALAVAGWRRLERAGVRARWRERWPRGVA